MTRLLGFLALGTLAHGLVLSPDSTSLRYEGRHLVNSTAARFDWVGTGVALRTTGACTRISVDMDGGGNRFGAFVDGRQVLDFVADGEGRKLYAIARDVPGNVSVELVKTSESNFCQMPGCADPGVTLSGVVLEGAGTCAAATTTSITAAAAPPRRIDVFGDSDSAAFGVDGSADALAVCAARPLAFENWAHGWVHLVAQDLAASVRDQAISGIGVVQNDDRQGAPLPAYLNRTLRSVARADYDAAAQPPPSVVVFYVGSNDYVAPLRVPSRAEFEDAYGNMVSSVVDAPFAANPPPAVHVCGPEDVPCEYVAAVAASRGEVYTTTGDAGQAKAGCLGHRNATQQSLLAARLGPIIAEAAGWS